MSEIDEVFRVYGVLLLGFERGEWRVSAGDVFGCQF